MMAVTQDARGSLKKNITKENCHFLKPLLVGDEYHKVYIDEQFRKTSEPTLNYWHLIAQYGIITENFWEIDVEMNEWLTENCKNNWGIFVEYVSVVFCDYNKTLKDIKFTDCLPRVFVGFENLEDALLFKLSCF